MFRLIDAKKTVRNVLEDEYPNAEIETGEVFHENYDFNIKQVGSCIYVTYNNHYFVDEDDKERILEQGQSETSDSHLIVDEETHEKIWFKLV